METLSIKKKNSLLSFLTKKTNHPKVRFVYAVTAGAYLGELLVYMETLAGNFYFLSLPTMTVRIIPVEKFNFGLQEKIVDIVEKIPGGVFEVCKLQYRKNKG
jgi:hypothetical protein